MIDTSVLVAGLVTNHEHHALARPHVAAAAQGQMPGIVIAETWAALRRAPWNLDARTVEQALSTWSDQSRIVATPASTYAEILRIGRSLNLGGNVHDLLIALTCRDHGLPLVTLDRRQSTLAAELVGLDATLLLPTGQAGCSTAIEAEAERLGLSRTEYLRRQMLHVASTSDEPVSVQSLRQFARTFADLGDPRSCAAPAVPDLLIAATAELAGLTVLHRDRDLDIIADVTGQQLERLHLEE